MSLNNPIGSDVRVQELHGLARGRVLSKEETVEFLRKELTMLLSLDTSSIMLTVDQMLAAAIAAEREECLRIAQHAQVRHAEGRMDCDPNTAKWIADQIESRGK